MIMPVLNYCGDVMVEIDASIKKHGDWSDYTFEDMHRAIDGELMEFEAAKTAGDITGPHGTIRELRQVIATYCKLAMQMEVRMKLFCEDGHEWFGECLPAVCPFCHKDAIGAKS